MDREVVVTGMGFCLPGGDQPIASADEFWDTIAHGRRWLDQGDGYFGVVRVTPEHVNKRAPELPERYLANYSDVQLYGLVALLEAAQDARLDWRAGALQDAAVLVGRNGNADPVTDSYLPLLLAEPDRITPKEARSLLFRNILQASISDVEMVQAPLVGSTGPSFSQSAGCASSAVLLGTARRMIAAGEVDVAVVTGADFWRYDRIGPYMRLMNRADEASQGQTVTLIDDLMRPYDRNAKGLNYGNGAVTLILESRAHAESRAATIYGRILGQATTRNAQPDLAIDLTATAPIAAVRKCLSGSITASQIDYVNGGAQGDRVFNHMESTIISTVFGERDQPMPVSVQEGCFGHNGAVLGNLGVAATLLMMRNGVACPTTGCDEPDSGLSFNPLPGNETLPLRIDHAVSLNYTIGSVASAILLGSEVAA